MDPERYLAHLRADIEAMLALPPGAADADVAACPGWTVDDLLAHVAGIYGFVAAQLAAAPGDAIQPRPDLPGGDGRSALAQNAELLLARFAEVDPDEHRPNWAGKPTAGFWWRRMAQESCIHRWDAQLAAGEPQPIPTDLAVDGIEELFDTFLPFAAVRGITGEGETVHLHATDTAGVDGGEWLVTLGSEQVTVERTHTKAQMAVRGTASDLLLFCWNRRPIQVEAFGEPDPLEFWSSRVRI